MITTSGVVEGVMLLGLERDLFIGLVGVGSVDAVPALVLNSSDSMVDEGMTTAFMGSLSGRYVSFK